MASRFSQNFTLLDIFTNKKLRKKLPIIRYKETINDNGKLSQRTSIKDVRERAYQIAKGVASQYYTTMETEVKGDTLVIKGNIETRHHSTCVSEIFQTIKSQTVILKQTEHYMPVIREALKESQKNKYEFGIDSKLYLRANSIEEIKGMSVYQIQALWNDIMENIMYSDNFPKTQKKLSVKYSRFGGLDPDYNTKVMAWKRKVGDL